MNEVPQTYSPGRSRVLVVSAVDVHENRDALPSAWGLAEALASDYDVILATPTKGEASHAGFAVVYYNRRNLALLSGDSDLVVVEAAVVNDYDFLSGTGKLFLADWDTIISGSLSDTALLPLEPDSLISAPPADTGPVVPDFRIWLPPVERRGISHYMGRLRFHMRAGGPRRVLSRGVALVKSKLSGR